MFNNLPKSDSYVNNLRKSALSADKINKISVNPCQSVSNFLPIGMAYVIGYWVSSWFFIPYYSYRDLSLKNRVNLRNHWLKMTKSSVKNNKIRANLRHLRIQISKSADIFMQNKAKLKNAKITLTSYMTNRYEKICFSIQPKNKAKTKPNKAKSNPILTPLEQKQTQTNPIYSDPVESNLDASTNENKYRLV